MAEEVKDRVRLETRQSVFEEKQRTLESNLEGLQGHRKEVVETRKHHLAEVDQKIQSITEEIDVCRNELSNEVDERIQYLETYLGGLRDHRKEVVETREHHLAEVDQKIQSITDEIDAYRNELSKIADLQAELRTATKE